HHIACSTSHWVIISNGKGRKSVSLTNRYIGRSDHLREWCYCYIDSLGCWTSRVHGDSIRTTFSNTYRRTVAREWISIQRPGKGRVVNIKIRRSNLNRSSLSFAHCRCTCSSKLRCQVSYMQIKLSKVVPAGQIVLYADKDCLRICHIRISCWNKNRIRTRVSISLCRIV